MCEENDLFMRQRQCLQTILQQQMFLLVSGFLKILNKLFHLLFYKCVIFSIISDVHT